MHRIYFFLLCVCIVFFSGCFSKKNTADSSIKKLPTLGVTVKIPENFQALPQEQLSDIKIPKTTKIDVEPFIVDPLYVYTDSSGKGLIIISELKFMEGLTPERFPMNNVYTYRKNMENYFASGEISGGEIGNDDITTVLLTMVLEEDGSDFYLLKGLSYIYPNRFFMIDLYVMDKMITEADVSSYINMFDSLRLY